MKEVWKEHVTPFRIFGNLYFVGMRTASAHLIDTGDGLMLIDTGYPQTLYLVLESIWELGFDPRNIRKIVLTHGHYDHLGAVRALKELTGAETCLGRLDRDYANGTRDLTWAKELGYVYEEQFEPDHLLDDGDVVTLGNTEITAVHTPGHTEGTMSLFFNVSDGKRVVRAGMHGGGGLNSITKEFLEKYHLPLSLQEDFRVGLNRCRKEKVDLPLGNHAGNNNTFGKGERVLAGDGDAFLDPQCWFDNLDRIEGKLDEMLAKERGK